MYLYVNSEPIPPIMMPWHAQFVLTAARTRGAQSTRRAGTPRNPTRRDPPGLVRVRCGFGCAELGTCEHFFMFPDLRPSLGPHYWH